MSWMCPKLSMVVVAMALFSQQTSAQSLVSESEYRIYGGALEPVSSTPTVPGSPEILIVKPELDRVLVSPVSIQLMVVPTDGSSIHWDSFKLSYGALRFDITDRFLRLAKKTPSGFKIDGLEIPAGDHRLQMSVRDNKNRWGSREFVLHVSKAVGP